MGKENFSGEKFSFPKPVYAPQSSLFPNVCLSKSVHSFSGTDCPCGDAIPKRKS